jgi:hypothetical protein
MSEKQEIDLGEKNAAAVHALTEMLINFAVAVARTHPAPERLLAEFKAEEAETSLASAGITDPTPAMKDAELVRQTCAESLYRVIEHRIGRN